MSQTFEWMLPKQIKEVSKPQADDCLQTIETELACLDIVVDAAELGKSKDFALSSGTRRAAFVELRRHAFGKTVVIKTSQGVETFRVSQANCEFASTKIGYASPLSPVGRLCRIAYLGFSGKSKLWGNYEVIEVRTFSRFMGQQAEDNIRNFQLMRKNTFATNTGTDDNVFNIKNLRTSAKKWFRCDAVAVSSNISQPALTVTSATKAVAEPTEPLALDSTTKINAPHLDNPADLSFDGFDDSDDSDFDYWEDESEELEHGDLLHSDYEQNDFFGIHNGFYLSPTTKQEEVMNSHFSSGPMLVEGVAGSGKTCVAIGRAKTLCDSAGGGERLVGDNSKDFFAQESSVGFVRTGELVQYLKATCLELGLSHLPIQEYKVLQHDLRARRDIEQRPASSVDKDGNERFPKYQYLQNMTYAFQPETTMAWVSKVDQLIGAMLQQRLVSLSEKITLSDNLIFNQKMTTYSALQISQNLIADIKIALQPLMRELITTNGTHRPYSLDSYAKKSQNIVNELDKTWFNKDSLWINPVKEKWLKVTSNKNAISKLKQHDALFLRIEHKTLAAILLTSIDELDVVLAHIGDVFDKAGEKLIYDNNAELWKRLVTQSCRCSFAGRNVLLEAADEDDVLFCAAAGSLGVTMDGKNISKAVHKNPLFRLIGRENKEKTPTKTSLANEFRRQINGALFNRLQYADLYLSALKSDKNERSLASNEPIIKRLENRQLADHDIDVLLSIAQIMSRGAKDLKPAQFHLQEQDNYFRTVFIDEVQDFSEVQVFLMGRQAHPEYNSVTMVGDLYQQLYSGSAGDPALCFPYQGSIEKSLLIENKRQEHKPNLMALSSLFRAELQGDERLMSESSTYQAILDKTKNDDMRLFDVPFNEVDEQVIQLIKAQPKGRTVSVVCPTTAHAIELEARLHPRLASEDFRESYVAEKVDLSKKYLVHFSSPEHIKGLEFDTLIMAGFENMDWHRADELNKVYVCISRPRKQLAVLADFTKIPNQFIKLFS